MGQTVAFPKPASGFTFYTMADLAKWPPPEWLIEGVCYKNSQVMMFGPSNEGKSFVGIDIGLSVATGRDWHGHTVTKGPVVFITGEGGPGIFRRMDAWCAHHHIASKDLDTIITFQAPQLVNEKERKALIESIRQRCSPVLISIDTLARCFVGFEENGNKEAGQWNAAVSDLQDAFGATVMTTHHTKKAKKDQERGAGGFYAALDTAILVRQKSAKTIMVSCKKQRDEEFFEDIPLTLAPVEHPLDARKSSCVLVDGPDGGVQNVGLGPNQWRLLRALARCSEVPTPVADWQAEVDKDGKGKVPEKTFGNWRQPLMKEYVVPHGRGYYELTDVGRAAIAKQPPTAATS